MKNTFLKKITFDRLSFVSSALFLLYGFYFILKFILKQNGVEIPFWLDLTIMICMLIDYSMVITCYIILFIRVHKAKKKDNFIEEE